MRTPYFEEVQTLRNRSWLWLVVIVSMLTALISIGQGLYWQLVEGEPWGNEPMSNAGLIAMFVMLVVVDLIVIGLIYNSKLEIRIDESGVHYRSFPKIIRWRTIVPDEILDFQLRKLNFFQAMRIKKFQLGDNKVVKLLSPSLVELKLKNGTTVSLGTENPEGIGFALKRLLFKNEVF
jgi:hypothetical protein